MRETKIKLKYAVITLIIIFPFFAWMIYKYNIYIDFNKNISVMSSLNGCSGANINMSLTSKIETERKKRNWIWFTNHTLISKLLPNISHDSAYDVTKVEPISFDQRFKNPCWEERINYISNRGKVRCLPYLYLIGVKKSGTTDLFSKISKHPDFCQPLFSKECQWISSVRFNMPIYLPGMVEVVKDLTRKGIQTKSFEFYVSLFDYAAKCITGDQNASIYNKITADSSTATLFLHTGWEQLQVNKNLDEPRYTNFHFIKQMTPNAKLIIIFRDPTERLYTDFLFNSQGKYKSKSPEIFHKQVEMTIAAYRNCFQNFTIRSCVYNNTLRQDLLAKHIELAVSFTAGFYAVFMKDMIDVFGRNQIKTILMKDYKTNMEMTLRSIFSFLEMTEVSPETMKKIVNSRMSNVSKFKNEEWQVKQETNSLLNNFYAPFNEDMAVLMNDPRYRFSRLI